MTTMTKNKPRSRRARRSNESPDAHSIANHIGRLYDRLEILNDELEQLRQEIDDALIEADAKDVSMRLLLAASGISQQAMDRRINAAKNR